MKNRLLGIALLATGAALWWRKIVQEDQNQVFLKDKVVFITGGASGIGLAAAKAFAGHGAKLVLLDVNSEALKRAKKTLDAYDVPVMTVAADVREEDELQSAINATLGEFGRLDVLVNNAGIGTSGGYQDLPVETLHDVIDVNLWGTMLLTRLVLPIMLEQGGGHIVNVSSFIARFHGPGAGAYVASKAGNTAFTTSMRREFKSRNVRFSAVLPGYTLTPIVGTLDRDEAIKQVKDEGMWLPGGAVLDLPEVVGGEIVNAVRYNRAEVATGGFVMKLIARIANLFPALVDSLYAELDMVRMTEVVREKTSMERYKEVTRQQNK